MKFTECSGEPRHPQKTPFAIPKDGCIVVVDGLFFGKSMKTTIRDVAAAAGVSAMAVSHVLHGAGRNVTVSEETRGRIRKAAKELAYQPNALARSLRSQKTFTVGVVFQHFERLSESNPYYPQLLNGVMAALFEADYTLALCPKLTRGDEGGIGNGRFDGILWARPDLTETSIDSLKNSRIPLVMMHAPPGTVPGISTFAVDNDRALKLVAEHIAELGHRTAAFVVDEVNAGTAEGRARIAAFNSASVAAGIEPDVFVWDERPLSLTQYRGRRRDVTAMVAFSDTVAGHLLDSCRHIGIRVPHDISVIGFDSSSFCERTLPRLTSVFQPVEQMAYDATSYLLSLIKDERPWTERDPQSSLYECGLDIRESTSSPSLRKKINEESS
jgi:LacI family transcriptional regulator, galactose operon repressor